jgi:hypothetical protein
MMSIKGYYSRAKVFICMAVVGGIAGLAYYFFMAAV